MKELKLEMHTGMHASFCAKDMNCCCTRNCSHVERVQ